MPAFVLPGLNFLRNFINRKEPEYSIRYSPAPETQSQMPVVPENAPNYRDPRRVPRDPYGNLDVDKLFSGSSGYSDIPESMLIRGPGGRSMIRPDLLEPEEPEYKLPTGPSRQFFAP